jgi:transposase-like protein
LTCGKKDRCGRGALRRAGERLGINPETLWNWVRNAELACDYVPPEEFEESYYKQQARLLN